MQYRGEENRPSVGYEFAREEEARSTAHELDRRFTEQEMAGLRIYRVRWNGNYLLEATFANDTPDSRLADARAILGESGTAVHPDDLADYKKAMEEGNSPVLPDWIRRLFGV